VPGIHIPQEADTLPDYRDLVARLEADGYGCFWIGEVDSIDAVTAATLAALGSGRATVSLFLNTFTRAPTTLAMTASTLAHLAPGRAEVALGVGSPMFVEQWNGIPYRGLHARLRDTLRFVRAALAGERVEGPFESFETHGFALGTSPDPPPALLVAATGPRALRLAVEEADGVVLNWITPDDVARTGILEQCDAVSLVVPVCPTEEHERMDRRMRPVATTYLGVKGYADQQRRLGHADLLEPMWAAQAAGDRDGAKAAFPAALLDELVVWGSPAECRARLDEIEHATGARVLATVFPPRRVHTFAEVVPTRA
jgi:probable F420-dependent oxidoreductase